MEWNPAQYLEYGDARLRPALDLLARIPLAQPRAIVDLGCGAGNVAAAIAARWPAASIEGVDGDAAMLEKARAATEGDDRYTWTRADAAAWRPVVAPDLIYSNAALHWADGHETLFVRLLDAVAPGGALAVQMPFNFRAPSHAELVATAREDRFRDRLEPRIREFPVAAPERYYDWLAPAARTLDVWTTEYLQRLPARDDGEHPVVAWMRGAALLPYLQALDDGSREAFVARYAERIERAYPRRADGSVLFPFARLFVVAVRDGG
jgi:trans-aconitate 2-methyltransferase